MEYRKSNDSYYIRIDKNEEVFSAIKNFCKAENISSGHFQGIGGCNDVTVATLNSDGKSFTDHNVNNRVIEMVSLLGNVSENNNKEPHLHAHASFSFIDDNGNPAMIAGHMKEAHISYTGEIIFTPCAFVIERQFDNNAGIEVWKLQ